jgi:phosphoribosylanthranilate isomerase
MPNGTWRNRHAVSGLTRTIDYMTTAVKICGITRVEDAVAAARLGAHALGFVFYQGSKRNVIPEAVAAIVRKLPPFVTVVGLFVNADEHQVHETLRCVRLDLLQFHGEESPEYCSGFGIPYIKAIRIRPKVNLLQYAQSYRAARGLLLDAYVEGAHGGTGAIFDWNLVPDALPMPIVLSGGLDAGNVTQAIRRVKPWAVDVSSGVESVPGLKDANKMAAFFQGVRNADV